MANDAAFHKVRWHVPANSLGVTLPPGYHLLEAPLQLFLCYGDEDVARFGPGTDPKQIEQKAQSDAAGRQHPQPTAVAEDPITTLPWSVALRAEAVQLASAGDLHVIVVHMEGLDALMDMYGYKAAHSVLRQIARRMKREMGDRDRLTRHCGDKLLIFSARPLEEIRTLVDMIHQQVAAAGLDTDGDRLPHSRIGVATVDRLTDQAAGPAQAVIDAVIISAEVASTGTPSASAQASHTPQHPVPPPPTADVEPEPEPVAPSPPAGMSPRPSPAPEPTDLEEEMQTKTFGGDDTEAPVYELPSAETASVETPPVAPAEEEVQVPVPPIDVLKAEAPAHPRAGDGAAQAAAMPVPAPDGAGRIRFKGASLDVSGLVATATVKLVYGDREVIGRAVGRNAQERRLLLAAEAAARAITELLPQGYGVVVHDIQPAPPDVGKALWAVVLFLTPTGEESLLGIAPIDDMVFEAAGKAVLNAVNRRVGLLLGATE